MRDQRSVPLNKLNYLIPGSHNMVPRFFSLERCGRSGKRWIVTDMTERRESDKQGFRLLDRRVILSSMYKFLDQFIINLTDVSRPLLCQKENV